MEWFGRVINFPIERRSVEAIQPRTLHINVEGYPGEDANCEKSVLDEGDWIDFWTRLLLALDAFLTKRQNPSEGTALLYGLSVKIYLMEDSTKTSAPLKPPTEAPATTDDEEGKTVRISARQRQLNFSQTMRSSATEATLVLTGQESALLSAEEAQSFLVRILGEECTDKSLLLPTTNDQIIGRKEQIKRMADRIKQFCEKTRTRTDPDGNRCPSLLYGSVMAALEKIIHCSLGLIIYTVPPIPQQVPMLKPLARIIHFYLECGGLGTSSNDESFEERHQVIFLRMAHVLDLVDEGSLYASALERVLGRLQLSISDDSSNFIIQRHIWNACLRAQISWLRSRLAKPDWNRVEERLHSCAGHLEQVEDLCRTHALQSPITPDAFLTPAAVQRALKACQREKALGGDVAAEPNNLDWICANVLGITRDRLQDPTSALASIDRSLWLRTCRLVTEQQSEESRTSWLLVEARILIEQEEHDHHDDSHDRLTELLDLITNGSLNEPALRLEASKIAWTVIYDWPQRERNKHIYNRSVKSKKSALGPDLLAAGWRLFWALAYQKDDPWTLAQFCFSWIKASTASMASRTYTGLVGSMARHLLSSGILLQQDDAANKRRLVWCLATFVYGLPPVFYPKRGTVSANPLGSIPAFIPLPSPPSKFDEKGLAGHFKEMGSFLVGYLDDCLDSKEMGCGVIVNLEEYARVLAMLSRCQMNNLAPANILIHQLCMGDIIGASNSIC